LISSRRGRTIAVVALVGGACAAGAAALYCIVALRLPEDAPLARMYRTEADLAALAKAVDMYCESYGAYPPGGPAGLRLATEHLSRNAVYFPSGPPNDAWAEPFVYVPLKACQSGDWRSRGTEYGETDSQALQHDSVFFAPETYQLYSMGADRISGVDDPAGQADNITNWDKAKSWRAKYRDLNKRYFNDKRNNP